jgi:hypothetical protein
MAAGETALRQTLAGVLERYAAAVRQGHAADTPGDRQRAEALRDEIAAEFWALSAELGDLQLLLLRHCVRHEPDKLRQELMGLLAPDIGALVKGALRERHGR